MFEKYRLSHRSRGGWFNNFLVFDKFYQKILLVGIYLDLPDMRLYIKLVPKSIQTSKVVTTPGTDGNHIREDSFGITVVSRKSKIKKKSEMGGL